MRTRTIVCPLITNKEKEYLLCKMPHTQGTFPGKWGLPGGGVEANETILDALKREIREEVGDKLIISSIKPWTFRDDFANKLYPNGDIEEVYMIYLIFDCVAENKTVILNEEFEEFAWVKANDIINYDLNRATKITFEKKGLIPEEFAIP